MYHTTPSMEMDYYRTTTDPILHGWRHWCNGVCCAGTSITAGLRFIHQLKISSQQWSWGQKTTTDGTKIVSGKRHPLVTYNKGSKVCLIPSVSTFITLWIVFYWWSIILFYFFCSFLLSSTAELRLINHLNIIWTVVVFFPLIGGIEEGGWYVVYKLINYSHSVKTYNLENNKGVRVHGVCIICLFSVIPLHFTATPNAKQGWDINTISEWVYLCFYVMHVNNFMSTNIYDYWEARISGQKWGENCVCITKY